MIKYRFNILYTLFLFSSIFQVTEAQNSWDPGILEKANTGKNIRYLKEAEKEVIYFTNLARADGKLFIDTYLTLYLKTNQLKPDSFTQSLIKQLEKTRDLPMLYPDNDLYEIARDHATKSGKTGAQGHNGFEKRFKPVVKIFDIYGENCYYGKNNALVIVIDLLIDKGIEDLGHRKNLLEPGYNSIGVSIMPHKKFGYNCVMDFGRKLTTLD